VAQLKAACARGVRPPVRRWLRQCKRASMCYRVLFLGCDFRYLGGNRFSGLHRYKNISAAIYRYFYNYLKFKYFTPI
jgi:hypothetical protein